MTLQPVCILIGHSHHYGDRAPRIPGSTGPPLPTVDDIIPSISCDGALHVGGIAGRYRWLCAETKRERERDGSQRSGYISIHVFGTLAIALEQTIKGVYTHLSEHLSFRSTSESFHPREVVATPSSGVRCHRDREPPCYQCQGLHS